jgi:hypothetical protein
MYIPIDALAFGHFDEVVKQFLASPPSMQFQHLDCHSSARELVLASVPAAKPMRLQSWLKLS